MLDIRNVKFIFSSSDDERCYGTGPGPSKVLERKAKTNPIEKVSSHSSNSSVYSDIY